jgi:hypothetical protein
MKFEEVVQDIEKLVGIRLRSIHSGADIIITDVNATEGTIQLITASKNKRRSRSISELRRIWDALNLHKAVHVDSVLGGSGSSRNQPETILASLPYVEWLSINRKKHISFIGRKTHTSGTLKQMDNVAAQALRDSIQAANAVIPSAIIIVENTRSISSCLELVSGLSPTAIASGVYRHTHAEREVWIVNGQNLSPAQLNGVYVVLSSKNIPHGSSLIQIADMSFHFINRDGVNLLFCGS